MTIRSRIRNWRRVRHWRRAARRNNAPLREFVYLDEVSVYSLMASQVGPIATELTDTEASSLLSESSVLGGGNIGAAKLEARTSLQFTESSSRQVLRKSIVQTTFKDFYELKGHTLVLRPHDGRERAITSRMELESLAESGGDAFLVDADHLRRGALIEVEVALEAEAIFHAGEAISGMLDVIQDDPRMFGITDPSQLAELRSVGRILERLRAGLVPIRGTAPDLVSVQLLGREWIAHRSLLSELRDSTMKLLPVHVVGVAEQGLFWKDLRRVLFASSSYRLLGRLGRSGLHADWTPVKLVDVLVKIVPDFKAVMDKVNDDLLPTMAGAAAAPQVDARTQRLAAALESFAGELIDSSGSSTTISDLRGQGLLDASDPALDLNVASLRMLSKPIVEAVLTASEDVAPERLSFMRAAALMRGHAVSPTSQVDVSPSAPRSARVLDTEIIAIYW